MNKYIAIIVAEDKEFEEIDNILNDKSEIHIHNLLLHIGNINNKKCIIVKSGIGKVNAARTTQILTDNYNLDYVICLGSAGALNDKLNVGDIVIAKGLVQHDFDVTSFGREKGYIPDVGKILYSDTNLLSKFKNISIDNINIVTGIIASGDIFCSKIKMKNKIKEKFNADCVEMEGAAIAQVCYLNKKPFIVIRSISDSPNGKNHIDFEKYLETASKNCATIIKNI